MFLSFDIYCTFFHHQEINFNKIWDKKITTLIKKIDNLRSAKLRTQKENIRNINYNIAIIKPLISDCHNEFVPIKINKISTQDVRSNNSIVTHHTRCVPKFSQLLK